MGKILHNITIFSKETGKKVFIKEVDSSLTPFQITEKYTSILAYERADGSLVRKLTRFEIEFDESIEIADIQDGETLILLPTRVGGGGIAIRDYKDIHFLKYIIEKSKATEPLYYETTARLPSLYAVILYTDQDPFLATYFRENARELSIMSQLSEADDRYPYDFLFFVIEKPSDAWKIEIEKNLGALAGIYFDSVWERLEGNIYEPYDQTKAYDIARHFQVSPNQLPCAIFFTNLESYQIAVVEINNFIDSSKPIDKEYTSFFRMLFSNTQEAILSGPDKSLKKLLELTNSKKKNTSSKQIASTQLIELINSVIGIIANLLSIYKSS